MEKIIHSIQRTKNEIAHNCDGPNTAFVMIARAMDLSANGHHADTVANALYDLLCEHGYIEADKQAEDERALITGS